MWHGHRRDFLRTSAAMAAAGFSATNSRLWAQIPGERPQQDGSVEVLNPLDRVPVSMIIDDSTCLVNMARYAMPQFAEIWPDRDDYQKPWQNWPREIPDAFVRTFGSWCAEQGVKGKYSIVPYPALVGRLDRELPGWTKKQLDASLQLVRDLMVPNWDIHPEMITHTLAIDTKTGRPYPEHTQYYAENWRFTDGKSVDELADYLSYALQILKNVGLPCEGITTPGGFGSAVVPELAQATLESCRDVFHTEIPHYFKFIAGENESTEPNVEYASGLTTDDPLCVVSVPAATGDWFGGWDGVSYGDVDQSVDRFISPDCQTGRMVELIEQGQPALMLCHWPGIYCNGRQVGFRIFQKVIGRLHARYDNLIWMKLSEMARYWAAKRLTQITRQPGEVRLHAPFAAPRFTVRLPQDPGKQLAVPKLDIGGRPSPLKEVTSRRDLQPGTWHRASNGLIVCFDLPKGESTVVLG